MEQVSCDLCGSTQSRFMYERPDALFDPAGERYSAVECLNCGLGFLNPRPGRSEIGRFYPESYGQALAAANKKLTARLLARLKFLPAGGANQRILDIGAGSGDFLRQAAGQGWEVHGLEPHFSNEQSVGFKLYRSLDELNQLSDGYFDCITAWAVLEHLHSPAEIFRVVSRLLKPGGSFVFLTHNLNSLASRFLFQEDIPRHLYFFTHDTVQRYCKQVGLRLESLRCDRSVFSMPSQCWLTFLLRYKLWGRNFTWDDYCAVESRAQYFERQQLDSSALNSLRYVVSHPIHTVEQLLMPALERLEVLIERYAVFVGRASK